MRYPGHMVVRIHTCDREVRYAERPRRRSHSDSGNDAAEDSARPGGAGEGLEKCDQVLALRRR